MAAAGDRGRGRPRDTLPESERVVALFRCLLVAVVLTGPFFDTTGPPAAGFLLVLCLALCYCLLTVALVYRHVHFKYQRQTMLIVDIVLLTLLIHQLGGSKTHLFELYYVTVIIGAMWFGMPGAIGAAALDTLLFIVGVNLREEPDRVFYALKFDVLPQALLLFLAAILCAYLAEAWHTERRYAEDQRRIVEQFRKQIDMARELQALILPPSLPAAKGLEIGVRTRQAQVVVGGDYYDAVVLEDGSLGVCCADVSGKGVPGQLRLPLVKYGFRVCARQFREPATMIRQLNQLLCDELPDEIFVPLVYAVFSPGTDRVAVVGKHCPPMHLVAHNGEVRTVPLKGVALGVVPEADYAISLVEFGADDYLVLYSDGVIEAQDRRGEELGEAGLAQLLGEATPESAQDLANWLFQALEEHEVGAKRDDLTLVVIRRTQS